MNNQDEVSRLLELLESQIEALRATLTKAQAITSGVDNTWSYEEEMAYRERHAS